MLDGPAQAVAIAHQATSVRETAPRVHRRDRVTGGQVNKLVALNVEQNIGGDKQYPSVLLNEPCERRVNVRAASGLQNEQSQPRNAGTAACKFLSMAFEYLDCPD